MDANRMYNKEELIGLLHSVDIEDVTGALLYACFNIKDRIWVEDRCVTLLSHPNDEVAGLAATCLGHVARIHSAVSNGVIQVLNSKLEDERISGRAQDALDDIKTFAAG